MGKSAGSKPAGSRSTGSLHQSTVDSCVRELLLHSAGSRPAGPHQSTVDSYARELLAAPVVKFIGDRAADELVEVVRGKHQQDGGWFDRTKQHSSAAQSPYATPLSLGPSAGTRPAAGHPLNARA